MAKDYYAILGVGRGASQEEIQRAYKKLARKLHPDVSKEADAADRFKDLGEAYDVLKDPEKRKLYDRFGEDWRAAAQAKEQGFDPEVAQQQHVHWGYGTRDGEPFVDMEDIFGDLFGRGRARGQRTGGSAGFRSAGFDQEAEVTLSLEEAFRGGERELALGDPRTGETQRLKVKIPAGVKAGQRIRLAGKGMPGLGGGPPGDLYLHVAIAPHPHFRLEGQDLYTNLPLAPWEAVLGAKVTVPTLDGSVHLKVPAGSTHGRRIRLKGKGYGKPDGQRGDLYAEVQIDVPSAPSAEEKALWEQLAAASQFDPRSGEGGP